MGFYSEENCQTEAHEPLLDWASGRKPRYHFRTGKANYVPMSGHDPGGMLTAAIIH